jgi:hypothetical protein
MAIVIAVMAPLAMNRIRQSQLSSLKSTLDGLQTAILGFRADVTKYPRRLQLLMENPTGGKDACSVGLSATNANKWRGPYVSLSHPYPGAGPDTIGVTVADWYLRDSLIRTPSTAATASSTGRLEIEISPLRSADATYLNTLIDGLIVPPLSGQADTAGSLRWVGVSGGYTLSTTYGFIIAGC